MEMKRVMACVVLLAGFVGTTMANEHVRNGMPCLNGICLGDDISTLSRIKWDAAQKWNLSIGNQEIEERFALEARAAAKEVYPYLKTRNFDNGVIQKLSKIKGFCKPFPFHSIYGTFSSASGFFTQVHVGVTAEAPDKQSLRVTSISRKYPQAHSSAQQKELKSQFQTNYSSVKKPARWSFSDNKLELSLLRDNVLETMAMLKQYPGCGKAISID